MESSTSKFEINLTTLNGEVYSDIIYTSFLRFPIVKQGSFVIIRANMTSVIVQQILNDLSRNIHPTFKLQIYHIDEKNKRIKTLFNKPYEVLTAKTFQRIEWTSDHAHVQMVLVNPILRKMGSVNAYNTLVENKTCIDSIDDYEGFLKSTYGDCFYSNHIGKNVKKNDYVYEQILINTKTDLHVPEYLISNFKPFHSFAFYFFDDFHISKAAKENLSCHFINLYDPAQFERFDIGQYYDIAGNTRYTGKADFIDNFQNILKDNETVNISSREMKVESKIIEQTKNPQIKSEFRMNEEFMEGRDMSITKDSKLINKQVKQTDHFNLYTPDNTDNALERITAAKEMISNRIDRMEFYVTIDCLFDWLQFGKMYNLDADKRAKFVHTPIGISNIFTRISNKDKFLKHMAKYSVLKYNEDIV